MTARIEASDIVLGGIAFKIRPLSISQVQAIDDLLSKIGQDDRPLPFAIAVVKIAMARDHCERDLDDLDASAIELPIAMNIVLSLGGFVQAETPRGEAEAAAVNASNGAPSKLASRRPSGKHRET